MFKKCLIPLLLFIVLDFTSCKEPADNPTSPTDANVVISSPKNGDTIMVASSYTIHWSCNSTSTVKIEISTDNGISWVVIADSVANNGTYVWSPVPNCITAHGKIRITTNDKQATTVNTGLFYIIKPTNKLLALVKPNGGENLFVNDSFKIEWISNDVANIKIEFSANNGSSWNLITAACVADTGYYLWKPIPNFPSAQCLVKITDNSNDSLSAVSKAVFSIITPQEIKVLSPNGGESWPGNTAQIISWYSSQIANVKIEYTLDNGNLWTTITNSTPSTGTYRWDPLPTTPSNNARIRISDALDGYPIVTSDSVFSIAPPPPINIIIPQGGENWMSGTTQTIHWNSVDKVKPQGNQIHKYLKKSPYFTQAIANIKIDYTTDDGSTWLPVVASTPNNGSYDWKPVPSQNSSLCRVKLSDADMGVPFVISNNFVIYNNVPRAIAITVPIGGELWPAGTTQDIKWTSIGVTAVNIDYTINGNDWVPVVANIPSTGIYTWSQVPFVPSNNCRIRITDAVNGFPVSTSPATFVIAPPPIVTVSSPNGSETIQSGSDFNITWTSTNVANVKIEYTTNGGADWNLISATAPSIGKFIWQSIPSINSSLCKIKISNVDAGGQPFDISDNNFTITNQIVQALKLNSPVGGEVWESGTSQNITWNGNAVNSVKIEFTSNNGIDWNTIVNGVPGSGSYAWSLPNINSTQCKVRISDATDGNPSDVSSSVFTIKPVATIVVTEPKAGAVFVAGDPVNIKWTSTGIQNVKIEYTYTNGVLDTAWHSLVNTSPSNGLYVTSFSIPTNQYRIRISEAVTGSPMAYSTGTFTVSPQPVKSVTVTSPNGGENWLIGTTNEIRWTSINVDSVKIEFSIDGGANWNSIVDHIPSNGLYNWTVPNTNFRSDLSLIRISDTKLGTIFDISDGYFSIHPNTKLLRWVFPNGGEYIWQDTLITWISTGVSNVNIEYTDNNGDTWKPVVTNYYSSGAYRWVLPNSQPSTLARLRIYDSSDSTTTDMSDSYFNLHIMKGIKLKTPNNYSLFPGGSDMNISWAADNKISSVRIEYWSDNSRRWNLVADNIPSSYKKINNYMWKGIPQSKENIQIRITDTKEGYTTKSGVISIK